MKATESADANYRQPLDSYPRRRFFLMGCAHPQSALFTVGGKGVTEEAFHKSFEQALTQRAAADPRNVGTPFVIPAREQAIVLADVMDSFTNGSALDSVSEPSFEGLYLFAKCRKHGTMPAAKE